MADSNPSRPIILRDTEQDVVYLRSGITVALFLESPIATVVAPLARATQAYVDSIPGGALQWQSIGASTDEWRPIAPTALRRSLALLDARAAAKRKLTAFQLADTAYAQGYAITVIGGADDPAFPDQRTLFEVRYPAEIVAAETWEGVAERARSLAEILPFVSGYASPALHWTPLMQTLAMRKARALAARYHGYDVSDNSDVRYAIGDRVRGARWITFLGPSLFSRLGPLPKMSKALGYDVELTGIGGGMMIRAGKEPELGDANKNIGTPLLREVARVLEPVTLFKERSLVGDAFIKDFDDPFLDEWERRFLD